MRTGAQSSRIPMAMRANHVAETSGIGHARHFAARHVAQRRNPDGRPLRGTGVMVSAARPNKPAFSQHSAPQRAAGIAENLDRRAGRTPQIANPTSHFQRPDPNVLSEAITAFFIGRNKDGFWVARDASGGIGGLFILERSAVAFAKRNSGPTGCATIFPSERFELDLENAGNRLIGMLHTLRRFYRSMVIRPVSED